MPERDDVYHITDKENARIPTALQPHLMASTPWAGIFFSNRALSGIARVVRETNYVNGFCEVRYATATNSLGMTPIANRNLLAKQTLRGLPEFTIEAMHVYSIWHKVKKHDSLCLVPPQLIDKPGL